MAGSFGFEANKYDVSVEIGERVLLPAVRQASRQTVIVADGFSCREQIAQATNRQALHLAEVIQMANQPKSAISTSGYPESEMVERRQRVRRKARNRAIFAIAAGAAGAVLLSKLIKKL